MTRKKNASSGKRLRASGLRNSQVWMRQAEYDRIAAAAEKDARPMTQILLLGGLEYAGKILEKTGKKA